MATWVVIYSELGHNIWMYNARNYRWPVSRSKVCHMCDLEEDESVENVVLKFEKCERQEGDDASDSNEVGI